MKNIIVGFTMFGCAMIFLSLALGCASKNTQFAILKHNDQVKQTFEDFIVPKGYNFYYFGSKSVPEAFIGLSKEFVIESSMWQPVELTSKLLHEWIWVNENRLKGDLRRFGSDIIGPNMEHIGIWYSLESWRQWARIELVEDTIVKIGSPIDQRHGSMNHSLF